MLYICPMHPEVRSKTKGNCPKCGMDLVPADSLKASIHKSHSVREKTKFKDYMPLVVVILLILLSSVAISVSDYIKGNFSIENFLSYFMIGFFLAFGSFKLIDLKGFAKGYATYDLLASRWHSYGYIYPFIEIFFGLSMIVLGHNALILWAEILVMVFSGIGVFIKVLKKERFQCVCLGAFLKVPLTTVTLIEDFGMAALAAILLFLS